MKSIEGSKLHDDFKMNKILFTCKVPVLKDLAKYKMFESRTSWPSRPDSRTTDSACSFNAFVNWLRPVHIVCWVCC